MNVRHRAPIVSKHEGECKQSLMFLENWQNDAGQNDL